MLYSVIGGVAALAVIAAVVLFLTGSNTPAICTALAEGKGALLGTREVYGQAGTTDNGIRILTEAAATVRQSCPDYAEEASQMDALAGLLRFGKGFDK